MRKKKQLKNYEVWCHFLLLYCLFFRFVKSYLNKLSKIIVDQKYQSFPIQEKEFFFLPYFYTLCFALHTIKSFIFYFI